VLSSQCGTGFCFLNAEPCFWPSPCGIPLCAVLGMWNPI
jgi:hypothetical protein